VAELQVARAGESPAQIHDCWNTIGITGNGSCRELLRFVHCRNCPVYSAAATELLDRPLTDDYRHEAAEHYAREKKLTTPAKTSVVIFRVASEWLALPTQVFQEIVDWPSPPSDVRSAKCQVSGGLTPDPSHFARGEGHITT
jgi:chemotaxis-related protein WspD